MPRSSLQERIKARISTTAGRPLFIALLAVAAVLTVAGCGLPGNVGAAKPTPTATPSAQSILAQAKSVHLTDETFTLTVQGTSSGTSINVTGTGKATENPARVSMSLSTDVNGTTVALDEVIDGATGTSYTRITSPSQLASKTWTKTTSTSGPISGSDLQVLSQYDKISNAKLVGSEQVNGVDSWHIQGTIANTTTGSDGAIDVYIHKSDYLPAKMAIHTTGDAALDVTITYTAVNTGVTVELPAA